MLRKVPNSGNGLWKRLREWLCLLFVFPYLLPFLVRIGLNHNLHIFLNNLFDFSNTLRQAVAGSKKCCFKQKLLQVNYHLIRRTLQTCWKKPVFPERSVKAFTKAKKVRVMQSHFEVDVACLLQSLSPECYNVKFRSERKTLSDETFCFLE